MPMLGQCCFLIYIFTYSWSLFFYHGLCARGYEAIDGMGVGSTSEFILNNVISIMNSTIVDASCYYGLELIES